MDFIHGSITVLFAKFSATINLHVLLLLLLRLFLCRSLALKCVDKNGSACCIKKMKVNRSSQSEWREQVEQEIYLLQNLKHPRIIKFLDCFHTTNHVNIVMELATEGPLSTYLAARRLKRAQLDQYVSYRFLFRSQHGILFYSIFPRRM